MSTDHSRPLDKKLIALLGFVRFEIIAQVAVLKAQPVKFADVPGQVRRIAERPLPRVINDWSIIQEKPSGPILVQLEIDITIAAIGLLALTHSARFQNTRVILIWNLDVKREALAVGIEFTPPRQTLINRAAKRLVTISQINTVKHPRAARDIACEADRRRVGKART